MSRPQDLPPDLHAALSLVVAQGKDYSTLAAMLGIEARAVHDRAHAALAMLAPAQGRELSAVQREQVGEYLLRQAPPAQQAEARALLAGSPPARAWALALSEQLAPLTARPLPEVPSSPRTPLSPAPAGSSPAPPAGSSPAPPAGSSTTAAPSAPAAAPRAPASRRGGAIVLGGLAAIVIAAVALIVGLSSGGGSGAPPTTAATGPSTTAPAKTGDASTTGSSGSNGSGATSTSTSGSTPSGQTHVEATLPLTPPSGSSSKALGLVEVASRGSVRAFLIAAEHLPPTTNFRYAAWLYNTSTHASFLLGRGPTVGSDGKLTAAGGLPENAATYNEIVLTEEHSEKPTSPGTVVLGGAFKL